MKARYYQDLISIYIHTDFDLRDFHDEFEHKADVEGVEKIKYGKYFLATTFGYMFDTNKKSKEVMAIFKHITGIEVGDEIKQAEIYEKALGVSRSDEEALENSVDLMNTLNSGGFSEA